MGHCVAHFDREKNNCIVSLGLLNKISNEEMPEIMLIYGEFK